MGAKCCVTVSVAGSTKAMISRDSRVTPRTAGNTAAMLAARHHLFTIQTYDPQVSVVPRVRRNPHSTSKGTAVQHSHVLLRMRRPVLRNPHSTSKVPLIFRKSS